MRMSEWSSDVCSSDLLAPERVGIAAAEESQRLHFVRVGRVDARQRLHVQLVVEAVDEGADELALVKQVQRLRRRIDVLDVAGVAFGGRQELGNDDGELQIGRASRRERG